MPTMTAPAIYPVVLCGGAGTRLWPTSRRNQPKQFAMVIDGYSLFQHAIRLVDTPAFAAPFVVTGTDQRFRVMEQMGRIERTPAAIIVEPDARNTAPAILAAALDLHQKDPDALMLVLPSDHRISDVEKFRNIVAAATGRALSGDLVTFGIRPDRAETGYGYLELSDPDAIGAQTPQSLVRFVEKPDAAKAQMMLDGGRHLWNAGIFLMSVRAVIAAYDTLAPAIFAAVRDAIAEARVEGGFTMLGKRGWLQATNISVDFAIMEKSSNLAVMPYAGQWSDLGDWASVWRDGGPDADGNLLVGDAISFDCRDSMIRSDVPDQMVVGLDLDQMIVVATNDAVLVAPRAASQRLSMVVTELRRLERAEADRGRRDHRPWGWYESLAVRDGFQVKQIVVDPHHALSLQSHNHRAEHWIILSGNARISIDDCVQDIGTGGYVFIPLGAIHRLENVTDDPVVMVEVQIGTYLGEDDIIRYSDRYARVEAV
jgi:mannose-1-phosphate guanylyltransferase / mannose-6-phosphate isomerase